MVIKVNNVNNSIFSFRDPTATRNANMKMEVFFKTGILIL